MAFTDALTAVTGNPTKASDYNSVADNTEFNRTLGDAEHSFAISGGDGTHTDITCTSMASSGDIEIANTGGSEGTYTATFSGNLEMTPLSTP